MEHHRVSDYQLDVPDFTALGTSRRGFELESIPFVAHATRVMVRGRANQLWDWLCHRGRLEVHGSLCNCISRDRFDDDVSHAVCPRSEHDGHISPNYDHHLVL